MHAMVIRDEELVWERRPDPEPGPGELLIAVRAAGINSADLSQRRGTYPAPPGVPEDIPGLELAGEIAAIGAGVARPRAGDRVMALVGGGAQATMAVIPAAEALPVPDGVNWAQAGGFAEVFSTAYDALFQQAKLGVGDRLLVTGAAGGVGTAAIQLGAVAGARVTAAVRDASTAGVLHELGADEVVSHADLARGGPYDVVLELVGGESLAAAVPAMAVGARAVVIGVGAGSAFGCDLRDLMTRRATISASTLRARPPAEKAVLAARMRRHVLPLLSAGRLRVPIQQTFPLAEAAAAYDRFAAGGKLGKIVLLT